MMFSPRMMPWSLLVYALIGMCVSGCVKMNVIGQDGEKKGSERTSEGFSGFDKGIDLQIAVHTAAIIPTVTPAEVTTFFNRASRIAQLSDELGDVECDVKFTLKNSVVGTFDDAPQFISWGPDFQELNNKYSGVKVVLMVLWCGVEEPWPGFLGCTEPGRGVAVVRTDPLLEPILAVHEANHVFGGVHRDEPNAVMNSTLGHSNNLLNSDECLLFR
jgi:hypothetical protein